VDGRTEYDLHGCDVHRFEESSAPGLRRGDLGAELRGDLRRAAPAAAQAVPRNLRVSPFHRARRSSVRSSSRARAGSARTGTRPTPRCWPTCPPNGRRRRATPGPRSSTRRSRRWRRGAPARRSRCTT
jgi:hypothetical protein